MLCATWCCYRHIRVLQVDTATSINPGVKVEGVGLEIRVLPRTYGQLRSLRDWIFDILPMGLPHSGLQGFGPSGVPKV